MKTPEWKTALEPFAIVIAGMTSNLENMEDAELLALRDACLEVTSTNCWCYTYTAAKTITPWIDREINLRPHLQTQA